MEAWVGKEKVGDFMVFSAPLRMNGITFCCLVNFYPTNQSLLVDNTKDCFQLLESTWMVYAMDQING